MAVLDSFANEPEALDALRTTEGLPPGLLSNPFFDDEPTELPPRPARDAAAEEETKELASPAPAAPEPAPQAPAPQPAVQYAPVDPNQIAQAVAYALAANQPRPAPRPEDYDPPEVEVDEEAILEGRASLKKALRDATVQTARHVRAQLLRDISPEIEQGRQMASFLQGSLPMFEWNARSAARYQLVKNGYAKEGEVEDLLDQAAQVIQGPEGMQHRLSSGGWVAAAQFVRMQPGAAPVKEEAKPQKAPGVGRGDTTAPRRQAGARAKSNPYIQAVEALNGKPLSPDALKRFEETHYGR